MTQPAFAIRLPEKSDPKNPMLEQEEDDETSSAPRPPLPIFKDSVPPRRDRRRAESLSPAVNTHEPTDPTPWANPMLEQWDQDGEDRESDDSNRPAASPRPASNSTKRTRDSRFVLTEQHEAVLQWTEKARYTSKEQVAVLLEVAPRKAVRLLDRLVTQGFLGKKVESGSASAYFLTDTGKKLVGSEVRPVKQATGMGFVPHTLQVGWLMLMLLKRESKLTEVAEKRLGRSVELDDFLTESELARAINRKVSVLKSAAEERTYQENGFRKSALMWEGWTDLHREAQRDREDRAERPSGEVGRLKAIDFAVWPPLFESEERKPHYPDLILRLGTTALAFEIERTRKPESVAGMVRSYSTPDGSVFAKVIWFCRTKGIQQLVEEAVEEFSQSPTVRNRTGSATATVDSLQREAKQKYNYALQRESQGETDDAKKVASRAAELRVEAEGLRGAIGPAELADDEASAAVVKFHMAQLEDGISLFRKRRLAALLKEETVSQKRNSEARAAGTWHVNLRGESLPCRCGVTCMASHGQFPTEQAAREFAEELG